jgi:flagellar biosynthesis protein FlhG
MATQEALPALQEKKFTWAIGGGKGGTGKSFLTASLGIQLARLGRNTVIVDADLGAAKVAQGDSGGFSLRRRPFP